jgi:hypothetical protein
MATGIKEINAQGTATTIGQNLAAAQNNLLNAYKLKEGDSVVSLARKMGLDEGSATVRSLQLIAEQRFQSTSHSLNLFTGIMDKIDQLKQRLINKFSN